MFSKLLHVNVSAKIRLTKTGVFAVFNLSQSKQLLNQQPLLGYWKVRVKPYRFGRDTQVNTKTALHLYSFLQSGKSSVHMCNLLSTVQQAC